MTKNTYDYQCKCLHDLDGLQARSFNVDAISYEQYLNTRKVGWDDFPCRTLEEALVEDALDAALVQAGQAAINNTPLSAVIADIKNRHMPNFSEPRAESEIYGFITALIYLPSDDPRKQLCLQEKIFKRIRLDTAFALAIKCVRANNRMYFDALAHAIRDEFPMRLDLTLFSDHNCNSLCHLAARCVHPDILSAADDCNPKCLEMENNDGDTIAHIACRFESLRCVDFLLTHRYKLFEIQNNRGVTPFDSPIGQVIINWRKIEGDKVNMGSAFPTA
jgi:hypothetical protein